MTGKARVLAMLSDRLDHSHMEGYRLGVMMHSRVSDLRKDGYEISCVRRDGMYWYRLTGKPGVLDDGENGDRSAVFPIVEPAGSTGGGAGGLAAASAARTAGAPAPSEDAAADSPSPHSGSAAAQPSLFDLPNEPAWA